MNHCLRLNLKNKFSRIFPIIESLRGYTGETLRHDLIAGLTVGIMLVPQGMAYAYLAGMPPIYGLYGGLIPLIVYALFGSSRQLSIGPVAISALLVLAGISKIAQPESSEYIQLVILTGLMIGLVQIMMSVLRMGFLVNFLSHPIIAGFTSAAAVIIAISQLKDILGIQIPRMDHPIETLIFAIRNISSTHLLTLGIGLGGIIFILGLKRINKMIPGALIAVIIGIGATSLFSLDQMGLAIVKEVPKGIPSFEIPALNINAIQAILTTVLAVTIIGVVESIGIAKVLESKHQNYSVRPNQELFALGISKVLGSFFQALPTSGSFTRSAVNNESGAKTNMASLVTALLIALTLLFLTPLFYYLPKAILASIILLAVKSLFAFDVALHLWHAHRRDFFMMFITFLATLVFGIAEGVLIGVLLSIGSVLYLSSKPHMAILGNIPGTRYYRNIDRFEEAAQEEGRLIIRFDDQLYFGNANYFKSQIKKMILNGGSKIDTLLLDASSIHEIDSSGMQALEETVDLLKKKGIHFYISGVIGPVRDRLFKSGLMDKIGEKKHFMYIADAVQFMKEEGDESWKKVAVQTNAKLKRNKK